MAKAHRAGIAGWKTIGEIASETGASAARLRYFLGQGKIKGQKDLTGAWRVGGGELDTIERLDEAIAAGVVVQDDKKFYSIAKAARDAAVLLAEPGTPAYRIERNRLNKRFQRQVYDTEIGQIRFEKRYYVPEEVYYRMISPLTLHRGGKTLLRGTERLVQVILPAAPVPNKTPNHSATKKPLVYDPNNLPLLKECTPGKEVIFYGRLGLIKRQVLGDPFRPQIQVKLYWTLDNDQEFINLVVQRS